MSEPTREHSPPLTAETAGDYLAGYSRALSAALASVDPAALERAAALLESTARAGGRVFAAGNGGSTAIADHLACDLTKGTWSERAPPLRAQSLANNHALAMAIANDLGFEKVFARQIDYLVSPGDVVVLISSSGRSPNVLAAMESARARGAKVLALTGFSGGELAAGADVSLHVSASNYGVVEDAHQAIMHVLAQYLGARRG